MKKESIFFVLGNQHARCLYEECSNTQSKDRLPEGFDQDNVEFVLDTKREFNKQITSNPSLG